MAQTNADGSIILSTTIDTSGIKKGLDQVKQKTKETTKTQQDQEKTTQKQTNAYEQLKKKVQEQTAALSKMKAEYANIILTEGKTSEAAQALSSKMGTLSGILEENKAKLAGVEQEANDLVSSFSKFGNEAQESAEKPKNAYQQLEETIAEQKTRLEELRQEYASLKLTNQGNTTQAKKLKAEINNLSAEVAENEARIKSLGLTSSSAFAQMKSGLMALASYFIGIQTIFAAIRFSGESAEFATQTEASVQRLVDIYGSASDSVGDFIDANARALGMSKAAAASFSSVYGNLFSVWADQATNAELTNRYLNMTAVVASKTGRTVEDVQERVRSGLLGNTEAIEDLGVFVNVKTIEMTDAFQRMADGKSWEQLDAYTQQQIRTFAILEQATAKYGDEVSDTSATIKNRFNAAYQDFQNSWGAIVNQVLLPVLQALTEIFNIATAGLNALSGRSGQILENAQIQEKSADETAENIENQADAQKDLNKEMKKTLAGFDEIQILSSQTAGNMQTTDLDNITTPSGGVSIDGSAYVNEIDETLTAIMGIVALSLAAVGLILLFTGNIAWGAGFIIAGASTLTVTMATASTFEYNGIIQMLTTIMGFAGGALLALGIILLYIGGIVGTPIAIGMIIAGGALIVSAVSSQMAFAPEDVEAWLSSIMAIAGGALLALGIILVMTGTIPLGVGMIVAGAVSVVSAVALNFDFITEKIKGTFGAIMAIAGGTLLVIGIILACSGVALSLAIPLIAVGAFALATPITLNWDAIVNNIKNFLFENSALITMISSGLLILGIILCATGVALPLGIALIAAGASGLVTVISLNSNAIVDWIKGVWDAVVDFWDKYIAPVFTLKFWEDLAKACGNGLLAGFEAAVNGIIWLFESMVNFVVDALNYIIGGVSDVTEAIGDLIGVNLKIAKIPKAYFGRVSIPRLAQGAVIPPNREFLAVLGDNKKENEIVSPVSTMKQAFMEAMLEMGGNGSGNTEVVLELNGRELGRAIVEQGNRENRRIGTRLVVAR